MNKCNEVPCSQISSVKASKGHKKKNSGDLKAAESSTKKQFSSIIDELKSHRQKKLNLESMEKNKVYKIFYAEKVDSQHGVRVLLNLEDDQKLYLPERYNTLSRNVLDGFCKQQYGIINHGKIGMSYDIDFEEILSTEETFIENDQHNFDINSQYPLSSFYHNYNP